MLPRVYKNLYTEASVLYSDCFTRVKLLCDLFQLAADYVTCNARFLESGQQENIYLVLALAILGLNLPDYIYINTLQLNYEGRTDFWKSPPPPQ